MLKKSIQIGRSIIGNHPQAAPYIIAEAGSNHNQSKDTALKLIDVAAEAGCQAVKFQVFRAGELYPEGTEMHKIFKSIELSADWLEELNRHSADRGIQFLASAFDKPSVDALAAVGVPAFKIASSETTNLPLLAHTARKGKPLIISTGMCDLVDVYEALKVCEESGNSDIALLQCGAMYPLPVELSHLRVMDMFSQLFECPIGFSDHTLGLNTSIAAVARGAHIIEKHFTLDRKSAGPDHFYAIEPGELTELVKSCTEVFAALGSRTKEMLPEEKKVGRRDGVYAARTLKPGDQIGEGDLCLKRPAVGIRARYRNQLLGARVTAELPAGSPIPWESIEL